MTEHSIRYGAVFPQTEIGDDPRDVRSWAVGVQEIGFQHILAFDHVVGGDLRAHPKLEGRYTSNTAFHEVFVLFGYLAGIVPEMEFATGVLILPQRQTVLVAKQAAQVDVLAGGKFRLGVGIGWNDIEYEALNESFGNRARRYEEQIALLRALWTNPIVDYTGTWHRVDQAGLLPRPVQQPIPVWIGGGAEAAIRRAARIADGFMPNPARQDTHEEQLRIIADELAKTGREATSFGLEPRINLAQGDPEVWKDLVTWWRERGATHITANTMSAGFTAVDQHLDALARLHRAVSTT